MTNPHEMPTALAFMQNPWQDNGNSIWLGSTLTLFRNLEKYKFPSKAGLDRRQQIVALISQQLAIANLNAFTFQHIKAEEISPTEKEFLFEHFLTQESLNQAHQGEAFLISSEGDLLVAINLHNHLMFHVLDSTGELEKRLVTLTKLESALGEILSYAFSPRFGFLTADPFLCGTALVVSSFLQLPALIHTGNLAEILVKNSDEMLIITGMQGQFNEWIGDMLVIRNNYKLGVTEEKIISAVHLLSTKLQVAEASQRAALAKKESLEIKDKVSRAYAILMHSYQIETVEAMNAISLLKLGLDLGWVRNITLKDLNKLFFSCRRAHLITQCGNKIEQELLGHKRAEFIHQHLHHVSLEL